MKYFFKLVIMVVCILALAQPALSLEIDKLWQKQLSKIRKMPERTADMYTLLTDMVPILMQYEECEPLIEEVDKKFRNSVRTMYDAEANMMTMARTIRKAVGRAPDKPGKEDVLAAIDDWIKHFTRAGVANNAREYPVTPAEMKANKDKWKAVRVTMKKARIDKNIQTNAKTMSKSIKRYYNSNAEWKKATLKLGQVTACTKRSQFEYQGQRNRIKMAMDDSTLSRRDKKNIRKTLDKIDREVNRRFMEIANR